MKEKHLFNDIDGLPVCGEESEHVLSRPPFITADDYVPGTEDVAIRAAKDINKAYSELF